MIRYALICAECEAEFEAWFASSAAYDAQTKAGLIECIACHGNTVTKQIMAPAVRTSGQKASQLSAQQNTSKPSADSLIEAARAHIEETCEYTGNQFPEEARAIYYGETEARPIWGETTPQEAKALHEEGIAALPLPAELTPQPPVKLPIKPPKDKTKIN